MTPQRSQRRWELSPPAPDWLLAGCLADAPTRKLVGGHLLPWQHSLKVADVLLE